MMGKRFWGDLGVGGIVFAQDRAVSRAG